MSEPEIARRCPSCGASIREKAFFCPQCGRQIEGDKTAALHDTQDVVKDVTLTEADFQDFFKPHLESPTKKLTPPPAQAVDKPPKPVDKPPKPVDKPPKANDKSPQQIDKPQKQVAHRAMGEVGARIQRATNKARDVEGNVVQRVQKFREISSVVIDEAGYDPSLRFVLVAAVLFLLFLLIVILNKFIG